MKTVVSVITHVRRDGSFLFRKKPDGSLPYKETWYAFGAVVDGEHTDADNEIISAVKDKTGITVLVTEHLWWDTEVKQDLDGETKFFVYLHTVSDFVSGDLVVTEGIEKLEWIPTEKLSDYAIVPPSRAFLNRYLQS